MNTRPLLALVHGWRETATELRRYGAEVQAKTLESAAADLEERIREWELEALTMEQAVRESGYSRSTLERRLSSGEVENAGEKGRPRILRRDLPLRGGTNGPGLTTEEGLPDVAGEILLGGGC